jgi:hypothetical protein
MLPALANSSYWFHEWELTDDWIPVFK